MAEGRASHTGAGEILAWTAALVIGLSLHHTTPQRTEHPATPRLYARQLALHRWHSLAKWRALDGMVRGESGWNPCSVYPSRSACGYRGSNSCGIPQANPCPQAWRGRLFAVRWVQVRWLIAYVVRRYGDPFGALAFHNAHGWF